MRTFILITPMLAGACAEQQRIPPDTDFRVPSMRLTELAGLELISDVPYGPDAAVACLRRYEMARTSFDCPTTIVRESPLHYRVTCPANPREPTLREVEFDDQGRLARYRWSNHAAAAVRATSYLYDEQGRLDRIEADNDGDGISEFRFAFVERDADGRPLTSAITQPPLWYGRPRPGTEQSAGEYEYDALGRLTAIRYRFVASEAAHYDHSVEYVDAARLRIAKVIIDLSSVVPEASAPGHNTHHTLFDEEARMIENGGQNPGDPPWVERYRYDELGRRVTSTHSYPWISSYTSHEIYDCP